MYFSLFVFLISIFLTQFFISSIYPFLKSNFLDIPNERSSHVSPIPTSGGITFVFVSSLLCFLNGNLLPIISTPLAVIGVVDDKYSIRKRYRFLAQAFTSILLIYIYLVRTNIIELQFFSWTSYFLLFFLTIFGVSIINFINFMDGIDGLLCGSISVLLTFSMILEKNYELLPLLGCLLVFTLWNWAPAKIFMGDSGSTFLGAIFVGIIFNSDSFSNVSKILIASFPLLGDACITVIRRFFNKENIFRPHKKQLFQRLVAAGYDQKKVTIIYLNCIVALSIFGILFNEYIQFLLLLGILIYGIFLEKYKAKKFN